MKQFILITLLMVTLFSCSKSKPGKEENNFLTMTLHFYPTGNPCTGYYFLSPQDSGVTHFKYNANEIPPGTGITVFPVTVQVSFHDLPDPCPIDLVFIDAIKK
jgi:hypothetical protein